MSGLLAVIIVLYVTTPSVAHTIGVCGVRLCDGSDK
jgi:hypothetical protein